jgi:hypothetical protein
MKGSKADYNYFSALVAALQSGLIRSPSGGLLPFGIGDKNSSLD